MFKLNTDVAFDEDTGDIGIGAIIRDDRGECAVACSMLGLGCPSAEAISRRCNGVAHALAREGRFLFLFFFFIRLEDEGSNWFRDLVLADHHNQD
ncbi:conserved hypothetical protein [Ricinus communis]|uniref:Uncharacterized protein n=1 Tax=Ricinus communis TaxID=3988 RepID=B9SK94_RICCO|nr:conserved hypothetical protein [Ricinus communis]